MTTSEGAVIASRYGCGPRKMLCVKSPTGGTSLPRRHQKILSALTFPPLLRRSVRWIFFFFFLLKRNNFHVAHEWNDAVVCKKCGEKVHTTTSIVPYYPRAKVPPPVFQFRSHIPAAPYDEAHRVTSLHKILLVRQAPAQQERAHIHITETTNLNSPLFWLSSLTHSHC